MSADKPSEPKRELTADEADRHTYETLQRDGRFVPQTPEEVAAAEAEINEPAVELPPQLRDPLALLNDPAPDPPPLTLGRTVLGTPSER